MQGKHLLQHEHRANNMEVGGFTSSPAISPSTVRANRNNHSFRSSTTVPSSSLFWNYFFTTLVLTKYRNMLLHVKGQVSNHSQKDSLSATQQKLVFCETHGKPLASGSPHQWKDLTCFTLVNIILPPTTPNPSPSVYLFSRKQDAYF